MKELTLREVAAFLRQRDDYLILTHRRPDGDTIGCAAALCGGLRKMGKTAHILNNPQFTPKFAPYLEGFLIDTVGENDCIVAIDIATERLLPLNAENYADCVSLLIDHHGRNSEYAESGYIDSNSAACGEIVLELLKLLPIEIDKKIAEAIYLAVSTDTGCFRYSNVTADTLRAAAFCRDCGADTFAVNQVMFLTKRPARLKLDAYLIETTEFFADGLVAVSCLPTEVRERLGITEDDIDDISGFGREIEGVQIGVMVRQEGENGKVSVRTSPNYDACGICAVLGGGGHRAAAGATVAGGIENARAAVLRAIEETGVKL